MPEIAEPDVSTVTSADHPLDGINADFEADDAPAEAAETSTDTVVDAKDDAVDTVAGDAAEAVEADKPPVEAKDAKPTEPKVEDKPAEKQEEKPAEVDPKAVEAQEKAAAAFQKWDTQFSETLASIDEFKPDEVLENPAKLVAALSVAVKGLAYARESINAQAAKIKALETVRQEETYWQTFQRQTPEVAIAKAQDIWTEELTKARSSYKIEAAAQAVATERFKDRIAIVKGKAKEPAAPAPAKPAAEKPKPAPAAPSGKPKAPVTKGGGSVIPKAGSTQPPKPPSREPEDEFAALVGQAGVDALLERA